MKILFVSNTGTSPVHHYRGEGVLERLRKIEPTIEVVYPRKEAWIDLLGVDVVFFLRCQSANEQNLAMDAMNMGVPIWYDIDDDLFAIPPENPASEGMTQEKKAVVSWFLQNANAVSVTTEALKKTVVAKRRGDKGVHLIPNALDDYTYTDLDMYLPYGRQNKLVTWRGGVTHQGDLLEFAQAFWDFLGSTSNVSLHFMGYDPWYLKKGFPWHKPIDYSNRILPPAKYNFDFYSYLGNFKALVQPWAHVIPLIENPFNKAKSNIALLEAVYAGAIPVVPDWPEWQFPAVHKYEDVEDFSRACQCAIGWNEDHRKAMWEANMDHLKKNYLLSVVNQKRIQLLMEVTA